MVPVYGSYLLGNYARSRHRKLLSSQSRRSEPAQTEPATERDPPDEISMCVSHHFAIAALMVIIFTR